MAASRSSRVVLQAAGRAAGAQLLDMLRRWRAPAVAWAARRAGTPYCNTIPLEQQRPIPGDLALEERITSHHALERAGDGRARQPGLRRARRPHRELRVAAEIFEVGFNHFFRAGDDGGGGDLVFFQPHSAPGVYARAFLEGRLERGAARATTGRRSAARGLCSYPHPVADAGLLAVPDRLDGPRPDQRDLPGALHALPAASRPGGHRATATSGACSATARWTSRSRSRALTLAAREKLDNLTFVINCNLQRLDGPVRGNGQIIQELESLFTGAGWNVIKVLWGSDWDALFARDTTHALLRALRRAPSTASTRRSAPTTAPTTRALLRAATRAARRWSRT